MKNGLVALAAIFVFAGLAPVEDASAARLGGGRSVGMQRGSTVVKRDAAPVAPTQSTAPAAAPARTAPPPAAPQPARSGLWGMLGGLALGVGLGALMSHFGMGAEFGGLLMVLALVFGAVMLFRLFSRRSQPQPQFAGAGAPVSVPSPALEPVAGPTSSSPAPGVQLPAGFDLDGFLRHAKLNFVRLQAANDAGNLDDIRQFTTPEMYAEIQLQYNERGRGTQGTDVVQLDAELLDLATEGAHHVGSVRFHGLIRESAGNAPAPFEEVWHLIKPTDGSSGWVLAGVEQFA